VYLPIAAVAFLLVFNYIKSQVLDESISNLEKLENAHIVFLKVEKLNSDMQTSLRGFIIKEKENYLEPYEQAENKINIYFNELYNFLSFDKVLLKRLDSVKEKTENWKNFSMSAIKQIDLDFNNAERLTSAGKKKFDEIRASSELFLQDLYTIKKNAILRVKKNDKALELIEVFYLGFVVFLLIYFLIKEVKNLTASYRKLIESNRKQIIEIERAAKAKDLFLANMSHEIRTPLGAIIGFSDLISKDSNLGVESKSQLVFIRRNSKHLLTLIDDIFDLSKVAANKVDIKPKKIDLKPIITDLKNIFLSRTNDKKIDFEVDIKGKIPRYIETDPTRLKQILTNLVGNAVKYSTNGSQVKMIVSYVNQDLKVDVYDTGIGINLNRHVSIFEPFSQADDSHSRSYGGAGLGLSISKKLAQLLGGNVELITSEEGVGSHFCFHLHLESLPEGTRWIENKDIFLESKEVKSTGFQTQNLDFSGKKILLVEDVKENQILFQTYLKPSKVEVTVVDNGSDAVVYALKNDYDLILMDIQMPGMDGYEAVKIIREAKCSHKIMALTAHSLKGEREKCLKSGFDDYVSKPVSQNKLIGKINSHLKK